MNKDLRYFQTLVMINFLPAIPFLRNEYFIYSLWSVSLLLGFTHLGYYLVRSARLALVYNEDKTPENRQSFAHFSWNFILMFFAYCVAIWMIYVSFKYTEVI